MLDGKNELLAKLMATEDIFVEQNNVPTAYFDTKSRKLVLPNWKNLSEMETEMLISHEIGHALYTPMDAWVAAIEAFDGNKTVFKHIMNVIEDPRIERGVKKKYPGTKKIFYFGYEELFERGIFTEGVDLSKLTIIDKLNLQFKAPGKVSFQTDATFWDLVKKIEGCEDFASVVALSKEIYPLCQKEFEESQDSQDSQEDKAESKGPSTGETQNKGQENSEGKTEAGPDTESQSTSSQESQEGSASSKPSFEEAYGSVIQENLEKFLKENVCQEEYKYLELPEPILDNILVPNKDIIKEVRLHEFDSRGSLLRYKGHVWNRSEQKEEKEEEDLPEISGSIKKFNKQNASVISYYTKVFNMKKKAKEYSKTLSFKTGKLDMNALTKYKFEDNLFLSTQIKQKGKNHGLVFYLDMSGSMFSNFNETIGQLLEIISFCRANQIPVSVYGFTDNSIAISLIRGIDRGTVQFRGSTIYSDKFALLELFSADMSVKDFTLMMDIFLTKKWKKIGIFGLGSTPLSPAINTLDAVVTRFRKATKAEIVNVVFLTDGGDSVGYNFSAAVNKGCLVDPKTKHKVTSDYLAGKYSELGGYNNYSYMVPAAILNLMKKRIKGINVVNFYIRPYDVPNFYKKEEKNVMEFDQYYYVNPNAFDFYKSTLNDCKENSTIDEIKYKFNYDSSRKKAKRTMIENFISKIC